MVDYTFYKTSYGGSLIPEAVFPEVTARAEDYLGKLERKFRLTPCVPDGRAMALCAVAEIMAERHKQQSVSETAVGDVKIKFLQEDEAALYRRIYNRVSCFFDIKRGVGG